MEEKMRKKLPIGVESFEKIRDDDFYYIDKTGLIRDLLLNWGEVNLFTRPRRFGKSLNMSMLKNFFEIGSRRELFDGLAIMKETELCERYMGKFPVVSVSLKGVSGNDYETAAHLSFITKSFTSPFSFRRIALLSCPPISRIVRIFGLK